jgi:hypothetical protein
MKVQELAEIVKTGFREIGVRFDQVDGRFEQVDARFEQVDSRFHRMDRRIDRVESETHKTRILVEALYPEIDALGEMIQGVRESLDRHIADPDAHRR